MQLAVLGINHKTAPVDIREKMAFSREDVVKALNYLYEFEYIIEGVILSTCNRTEIYAVVEDSHDARTELVEFFSKFSDCKLASEHLFYYEYKDAIEHLFKVASSLDSLIVGEGQIISQVKKAYVTAHGQGTTGTILNIIFQKAIAVGKLVRTETGVAGKSISVSSTAVALAESCYHNISKASVLILGAGEMSELTATYLQAKGVRQIFISNRTYEKAKEVASRLNGIAIPFNSFMNEAANCDILITSTGAPHYLINYAEFMEVMAKRQGRPMVMIDIAVPRDIDPQVGTIDGVNLFNIDSLESVIEENRQHRYEEAQKAMPMIEEALNDVLEKLSYLSVRPMMVTMAEKAEQVRRREVHRIMVKLPNISERERKLIESMSRKIVNKLLRGPMIRLHEIAGHDEENYYWELFRDMFNIKENSDEI